MLFRSEVGSDIRLPERKRLNVASWPHIRGQPQKLSYQVCFQRLNISLNAQRHITQELVMSLVQNSVNVGILNLPITTHNSLKTMSCPQVRQIAPNKKKTSQTSPSNESIHYKGFQDCGVPKRLLSSASIAHFLCCGPCCSQGVFYVVYANLYKLQKLYFCWEDVHNDFK